MLSIQGIYTGKEIKPLEYFHARPNVRVIITFLDNVAPVDSDKKALIGESEVPNTPTEVFLNKCGGWKDTRSPAEIITEIYASRTTSERKVQLNYADKRIGSLIG
jgi:hypothetical protein